MRKFFLFITLFFLCLTLECEISSLCFAKDVGGVIINDTVWAKADSPFIVKQDVILPEDITLTIEPGVTVKFDQGKALFIDGIIIAKGTSSDKIVFTSNGTQSAGYWGYISFSDTSKDATFDISGNYTGGCILQYATVQYGGSGNPVIKITLSSPFIDNSVISQNAGVAISITTGSPVISNCEIKNHSGSGIYAASNSNVTVSNSTISGNAAPGLIGWGPPLGGGGVYATSSTVAINNSTISGNSVVASTRDTYAISGGGGIYATSSTVTVNNSAISRNSVSSTAVGGYGCNAYSYGSGIYATSSTITVNNSTISENAASASGYNSYSYGGGVYAESGTTVTVSNSTISGNSVSGEYYNGGGVCATSSTVTVSNSTISESSANNGGGVCAYSGTVRISSSTFSSNIANSGGAIQVSGVVFTMNGNIITGNTASTRFGGIVRLENLGADSIVGGTSCNDANVIKDNTGDGVYIKGNPAFNYNDVYNNTGFSFVCGNATGAVPIDATNCYWGTDKESVVKAVIWDGLDDPSLGFVTYNPFLTTPCKPGDLPDISVTPIPLDFGNVNVGASLEKSLTVKNEGSAILNVTSTTVTGTHASEFSITAGGAPFSLNPGETRQVTIKFSPTSEGSKSAALRIESNDPDENPFNASLIGVGVSVGCLKGDVNGNGEVMSNDAILCLKIAAGLMQPVDERQRCAADMNCNGEIMSNDAILILKKAAGLPVTPCSPPAAPIVSAVYLKGRSFDGDSLKVSVAAENLADIAGADISIIYDASVLSPQAVSSEKGTLLVANLNSAGKIQLAWVKEENADISAIASVTFRILDSRRVDISLQAVELYDSNALPVLTKIINQELEALLIPKASILEQNYPNPFNPETWIPFQLSQASEVIIKIYEVSGKLVRTLEIGHKNAGIYRSKGRAAYWDGKDDAGEKVASGVYFYHLQAGSFHATRKLIVLK